MASEPNKLQHTPTNDGLFHLGTRDPGAWGMPSWPITTPEGSKKTILWDGQPGPLLEVATDNDGKEFFRPLTGDSFRVQVAKLSAAQRAVELFVTTLNDGILSDLATEAPAGPATAAAPPTRTPSLQPGLF